MSEGRVVREVRDRGGMGEGSSLKGIEERGRALEEMGEENLFRRERGKRKNCWGNGREGVDQEGQKRKLLRDWKEGNC